MMSLVTLITALAHQRQGEGPGFVASLCLTRDEEAWPLAPLLAPCCLNVALMELPYLLWLMIFPGKRISYFSFFSLSIYWSICEDWRWNMSSWWKLKRQITGPANKLHCLVQSQMDSLNNQWEDSWVGLISSLPFSTVLWDAIPGIMEGESGVEVR